MKNKYLSRTLLYSLLPILMSSERALASDGKIWVDIPFFRVADFCIFKDKHSGTTAQYLENVKTEAHFFMNSKETPFTSFYSLVKFSTYFQKNNLLAAENLGVNFDESLKSNIAELYKHHNPKFKKIDFESLNPLKPVVNSHIKGEVLLPIDVKIVQAVDYLAYGTYSISEDCRSSIEVTLHLVGPNGSEQSFMAAGAPNVVVKNLANHVFHYFQATKFPSKLNKGNLKLTILGGTNGNIGNTVKPEMAEKACALMNARLPTTEELELIDSIGDYHGGVSIGTRVWALADGMVYHPRVYAPSPVIYADWIPVKDFSYYCVK